MNNDSPERQKKIAQAIEHVAEQLVSLGYVQRIATHSSTGKIQIIWTERGMNLRREMCRILPLITYMDGDTERFDSDKMCAFMSYITAEPPGHVGD